MYVDYIILGGKYSLLLIYMDVTLIEVVVVCVFLIALSIFWEKKWKTVKCHVMDF